MIEINMKLNPPWLSLLYFNSMNQERFWMGWRKAMCVKH